MGEVVGSRLRTRRCRAGELAAFAPELPGAGAGSPRTAASAAVVAPPAATAATAATAVAVTGSARRLALETRTLKAIDQIWPGPGGEAPEAYAW